MLHVIIYLLLQRTQHNCCTPLLIAVAFLFQSKLAVQRSKSCNAHRS